VQPNYYVVRDTNGQALSYIYFEGEPGRRLVATLLDRAEAPANLLILLIPQKKILRHL
jgi:hypothetical protein